MGKSRVKGVIEQVPAVLLLVVWLFQHSCAATEHEGTGNACELLDNGEQDCHSTATETTHTCSLYLAASTIPNSGLGVFVTQNFKETDLIWEGDPVIPMVDLKYHQFALGDDVPMRGNNTSLDPFLDVHWSAYMMGMEEESSHPFVSPSLIRAFAPGLASIANSHPALNNFDTFGIPKHSCAGLHRSRDAGAGAFTPYHNRDSHAITDIPVGGEIYNHYGNTYFTSRDILNQTPLPHHHTWAENITQQYSFWMKLIMNFGLWKLFLKYYPRRLDARHVNALPKTVQQVESVIQHGIRSLYQPAATRSLDDLEKNGRCISRLRGGNSTLPQAGRGAFLAEAPARKGESVSVSPLIFAPTNDFTNMYAGDWHKKTKPPMKGRLIRRQIVTNYCLHHKDASLFLCPYSTGVNYINHARGDKANVELRWLPDGVLGHNATWLDLHPEFLIGRPMPGLLVEYVATRDISVGEEVFLDYGDEWQEAWDLHVANFEENVRENMDADYQTARDWNIENPRAMIRTPQERADDPYPKHFKLKCIPRNLTVAKFIRRWTIPNLPAYQCIIRERQFNAETGEYSYRIAYKDMAHNGPELKQQTIQSVSKIGWTEYDEWLPREALRFFDKPYSQDTYLAHAFRHPIGMPDGMLPDAWRGVFLDYLEFSKRLDESGKGEPKKS